MSKGVQVVVGELKLLKRDELAAPVRPGGGRVRVDVKPPRHRGLCLSRYRPIFKQGVRKWSDIDTVAREACAAAGFN